MLQEDDPYQAVMRRLSAAAEPTPYPVEAFLFVLQATPQAASPLLPPGYHIDAAELCWRLHDLALARFGSQAREQLEGWSIRSCDDFGHIVYALIDAGLMSKTEQDSPANFHGVFDFANAFQESLHPSRGRRPQWRLSTLFLITTVTAIGFAGFAKLGLPGALGMMFSSWLALIGVYCLALGFLDRSRGWLLSVGAGVALVALAVALLRSSVWR